ncbi:MAG: YicC family protein [Oscillospiraceae bacterium]|nr:YicC family protein [Oscillospiraceae bacterium]
MIKSMTGFGAAKGSSGPVEITVELKTVNNRHLDCTIKMPRMFLPIEETMRGIVQKYISRGKADVFVTVDTSKADDIAISVNHTLAKAYINAFEELADRYGVDAGYTVADLVRFPDVLSAVKKEEDAEQLGAAICSVLTMALDQHDETRRREGDSIRADVSARLDEICRLTDAADEISPRTVVEYMERLEARMAEVLQTTGIDEQRILTEAALFADKVAINEETVRLRSHVAQFRETLESDEPAGRKLDFLAQELNREANTIGSKCNDSQLTKVVVELKAEIEKIREHAQNVE